MTGPARYHPPGVGHCIGPGIEGAGREAVPAGALLPACMAANDHVFWGGKPCLP